MIIIGWINKNQFLQSEPRVPWFLGIRPSFWGMQPYASKVICHQKGITQERSLDWVKHEFVRHWFLSGFEGFMRRFVRTIWSLALCLRGVGAINYGHCERK